MNNIEIKYINIDKINPYENNPRNNDEAVEYVANSIKEFGFKVPLVLDKDYTIVTGHTRYKASKQLGLTEIPCIIADDLTDEQIKTFRLADNKVNEFSLWDLKLLENELEEIKDIDMSLFNIKDEFDSIIDILDEEGINKPKEEIGTFSVSFTDKTYLIDKLKNYISNNSKKDLEEIFIKVIKEKYDEDTTN